MGGRGQMGVSVGGEGDITPVGEQALPTHTLCLLHEGHPTVDCQVSCPKEQPLSKPYIVKDGLTQLVHLIPNYHCQVSFTFRIVYYRMVKSYVQ